MELGLEVKDAVVFLDREQGGANNLTALGINIIPVITMTEVRNAYKLFLRASNLTFFHFVVILNFFNMVIFSIKEKE